MKQFIPAFTCLFVSFVILSFAMTSPSANKINTYPNLPAPIAKENILITSAGQAVESAVIKSLADNLNLESDYRPRALATDLYDYKSVVIVVGYSKNGLTQTLRNGKEESIRSQELVQEAEENDIPVILVDISGVLREDNSTWELVETIIPHTTYYIGLTNSKRIHDLHTLLKAHHVPTTLVDQLSDMEIPFNSAYR